MTEVHSTANIRYGWATLFVLVVATWCRADEPTVAEARSFQMTGRYAEAVEIYEQLAETHPFETAIGIAACRVETGDRDAANEVLQIAVSDKSQQARLLATRASLAFDRGDTKGASELCEKAFEQNADDVIAHWVLAEVQRTTGKLTAAKKGYQRLLDYHEGLEEPPASSDMLLIAKAAAQLARWNRNPNQFRELVNGIYPGILKRDPQYWPAQLEIARLFAEKYNGPAASKALTKTLAINPSAAAAFSLRAELAMNGFELSNAKRSIEAAIEINPQCTPAFLADADLLAAQFRTEEAIDRLNKARELNPVHEPTLGRLAALVGVADQFREQPDRPFGKLLNQAIDRNEHSGEFFLSLANMLNTQRKYPHCVKWYEEANRRMPQLLGINSELGFVQMRLGEEVEAAATLEKAFREDPFHVRVKNMLEVIDVLQGYAVLETEHFVIRFDRGKEELLAQYAARYLEDEVYPEVVARFNFEPPEKTLFEIFSQARNTSGHGWFSARMVGLPFIGTVGACAGKMVALASPNEGPQKYNWARVLKHEFVHVVNLQQTDFNVPHWYTEGLAVSQEGFPRPPQWNLLLAKRVAEDRLFTLETVNFGFATPGSGDDWTLAYCQSELYVDYIDQEFGPESHGKLLSAFAEGKSPAAAIEDVCGVAVEDFEAGYLKFLLEVVADIRPSSEAGTDSLTKLLKAAEAEPENANVLAELAAGYLDRRAVPEARQAAIKAQKINPKHPLAGYVMARVQLSIGDAQAAYRSLTDSLDEDLVNDRHLDLLAGLELRAGRSDEAERLYRLAAKEQPHPDKWLKRLAKVYLVAENDDKLAGVLRELADLDWDNALYRKKLAAMATQRNDPKSAAKWLQQAIFIDIQDASAHFELAESRFAMNEPSAAAVEYEAAVLLAPNTTAWRVRWVEALLAAGRIQSASDQMERLTSAEVGEDRWQTWKEQITGRNDEAPPSPD